MLSDERRAAARQGMRSWGTVSREAGEDGGRGSSGLQGHPTIYRSAVVSRGREAVGIEEGGRPIARGNQAVGIERVTVGGD